MKRILIILVVIIFSFSLVSCKTNKRIDNSNTKNTIKRTIPTTAAQSTIHDYQEISFPQSWNIAKEDGAVIYSGKAWPNNELSNNLPKPNFGENMSMIAKFNADEVMFAINLENVSKGQVKDYIESLRSFGYLNIQILSDNKKEFSFSGKLSNGFSIYSYLNNSNSLMIQIDKKYKRK